jgi:uncharacterized protein
MALRRHTRNILISAFLVMGVPVPSATAQTAPPADALAAAAELFTLLSPDMMQQLTAGLTQSFWPLIQGQLAGKVDAAAQEQLKVEFERIQRDSLREVMKDAPAIYARHFTASELRELTAFYKTPLGQKSLKAMPQIMADSVQLIMPRMPEIQARTQTAFEKILRDRGYLK